MEWPDCSSLSRCCACAYACACLQLLRSFWLYCGLLKLAPASLPELHAACGSVAAATPLMVSAGVSLGNQAEVIERLKVSVK